MPKSGAYEISLLVDGEPLSEYDPPEGEDGLDDGAVVRYVQATEGVEFHVKFSVDPYTPFPTGYKSVCIHIDGRFADSYSIEKTVDGNTINGWTLVRKGRNFLENGSWIKRALMFKNLTTTEEATSLETIKKVAKDAGRIRIDITDVKRTASDPWFEQPLDNQAVPEKALKGKPIDMSAGYGVGTSGTQPRFYNTKVVGKTLAKFVIKYRSKRALQMLELIPDTPEPQSLAERDIDTLNPQEMRQLLAQMRVQESLREEQLAKVKQETFTVKDENEPGLSSRKRQSTTLEDDDDDCMIVEVKKRRKAQIEVDVLDLT